VLREALALGHCKMGHLGVPDASPSRTVKSHKLYTTSIALEFARTATCVDIEPRLIEKPIPETGEETYAKEEGCAGAAASALRRGAPASSQAAPGTSPAKRHPIRTRSSGGCSRYGTRLRRMSEASAVSPYLDIGERR
jgi:hypothetical protein